MRNRIDFTPRIRYSPIKQSRMKCRRGYGFDRQRTRQRSLAVLSGRGNVKRHHHQSPDDGSKRKAVFWFTGLPPEDTETVPSIGPPSRRAPN